MKPEEAIKRLNESIKAYEYEKKHSLMPMDEVWDKPIEVCKIAIKAIKKQIPAPPERRSDEYDGEYGYCPSCDRIISDYSDMRVCRHCGQKIQWQKEWVWK